MSDEIFSDKDLDRLAEAMNAHVGWTPCAEAGNKPGKEKPNEHRTQSQFFDAG